MERQHSSNLYFITLTVIFVLIAFTACEDNATMQNTHDSDVQQTEPLSVAETSTNIGVEKIKDQYIVVFNERWDNVKSAVTAQQVRSFTDQFLNDIKLPSDSVISRYEYVLRGFRAKIPEGTKSAIEKDPRVREVVQDTRGPVVQGVRKANISMKNTRADSSLLLSQTIPWGVSRVDGPLDGTGYTAWILDSGIDLDHNDLNVNTQESASFVSAESADDLNGHGTHVAGILAAINNSMDVVGVAAGAAVVSVKVANQNGNSDLGDGIDGVEYAAANADTDDIINMSLCYNDDNHPNRHLIDEAVEDAADMGFRFAIAAGNNSDDAEVCSPGRVEHSNVWTVSAYDDDDDFVTAFSCNPFFGSNYENPPIEYGGPGDDITSLDIGGGTEVMCGTSMAAPHIAGLLLASLAGIDTDGRVNNDPDNDADSIAIKADSDVSVNISGPSFVSNGYMGEWDADVSDGFTPYSYQWYRSNTTPPFWVTVGTGSSYSETVTESFDLKVEVTDASETTVSDEHSVATN